MHIKLINISEVCKTLRWGETAFYTRVGAGFFPRPFKTALSKKCSFYFAHEIEQYIQRAIHISSEDEFKKLAREIESRRQNLELNDVFN